jgi:hypothetical protein
MKTKIFFLISFHEKITSKTAFSKDYKKYAVCILYGKLAIETNSNQIENTA